MTEISEVAYDAAREIYAKGVNNSSRPCLWLSERIQQAIDEATAEKDKKIERLKKISGLQEEYIKLSHKESAELIGLALVHGWKSKYADEGQRIRDALVKAKSGREV